MVRSSVLLPQPDGPTSTVNSPSGMSRSMPRTACNAAVALVQSGDLDVGHGVDPFPHPRTAPSVRPRTRWRLRQHAEHDRRHQRDDGERARLAILRALEAEEGAEDRRQREGVAAGQDQGEEELGPAGDEGEHRRRDDAGRGERHGDAPEGLPARAAVDQRRLLHRLRHAGGNRRTSSTPTPAG